MKKLMFAAVLSLGSLTAFAQQDTQSVQGEGTEVVATAQDNYSEIAVEEVPQAVSDAVEKNYPTATIDKAYKNEENQFKLEVSLQDGTTGTLYADEQGNWLEQ
ncbi:MAG: hypothetical protein HKN61_09465 [Flavobacteriaceae bacterium]|nr:hypothetical protein [Flavobacteriaceae bacterium]